eukprot:PhM_4_TR3290/c1_g1_i1/m.86411
MSTSQESATIYQEWMAYYNKVDEWYLTLPADVPPPPPPVRHVPDDRAPIPYTFQQWCRALTRWKEHVLANYIPATPSEEEAATTEDVSEETTSLNCSNPDSCPCEACAAAAAAAAAAGSGR